MRVKRAIAGLLFAQGFLFAYPVLGLPDGVAQHETGAATYFMTEDRRTLYYHAQETPQDEFVCVDACLEIWSPLAARADQLEEGQWTIVRRPDDSLQWAHDGRPLYTYFRDTFPDARLGDGAGRGVWLVLKEFKTVPPSMKIDATLLGYVLANDSGHTLYFRQGSDSGEGQMDSATGESLWLPFEAPWLALDQGDLTIRQLEGGVRQWVYQGQPLYTFKKDSDPGDVHGHGRDGIWSAVILEKAPGLPPWMTVQWTDLGLAYADMNGMTLYAPVDYDVIVAAQSCPEECMQENWRPVLADAEDNPVGLWTIEENDYGQRQWTYKGRFLYTHTRDEKPGDMKGNGIAVGYRIGDGWRIIPIESGLRRDRS